ncbi:hypothetical protein QVD17_28711 [Tagetes erecta]|uniref:Transposase-associated domain-containing protein n=1 Tax=Tagetes erecta TaxID=13708 RepID=A0AAD8NSE8_TARER|nr:hypothetical protein QVD17_28711 [Tagetes erecta]
MTVDKSWTKITNKVDPKFVKGALAFANRGETYVDTEGRIHCPCKKCVNARRHIPRDVATHIIHNGFDSTYDVWIHHGEHLPGYERDGTKNECEQNENESNDGVDELLHDAFPTNGESEAQNHSDSASKHKIVELRHLWDIPDSKNAEDTLEDVNLVREDIVEEIIENVDIQGSDNAIDGFINDEIDDSDHSMEDFGSESNFDDSDNDKSNDEIEDDESDDDDL